MNANRLKIIIKKEFIQVLRDFRMRGILFGSPLLMLMIFGYAVNSDIQNIKMSVYDQDKSLFSRNIIQSLTASRYFVLTNYSTTSRDVERLFNTNTSEVFIQFGHDFGKRIKTGKFATIQVIIDGSDSNRAAVINGYITEIIGNYSMQVLQNRIRLAVVNKTLQQGLKSANPPIMRRFSTIDMKERYFFNPRLESRNFFLPGVIGLMISLITIMLTSMSIVKERESGTIEQIIVSPILPIEYILGKTIPFAIIGISDMIVISLVAIFWFDLPFKGSFFFLFNANIFFILSTLSVGLYISTISRTQQQAMLSFFLFFVPAILFSGFVFPIYAMPEPIQWLTYANPLRYFITILRGIFLKGVGLAVLWKELLALACMGVILLGMSVRRFSRRFE